MYAIRSYYGIFARDHEQSSAISQPVLKPLVRKRQRARYRDHVERPVRLVVEGIDCVYLGIPRGYRPEGPAGIVGKLWQYLKAGYFLTQAGETGGQKA